MLMSIFSSAFFLYCLRGFNRLEALLEDPLTHLLALRGFDVAPSINTNQITASKNEILRGC
jgi:hypothetical protein